MKRITLNEYLNAQRVSGGMAHEETHLPITLLCDNKDGKSLHLCWKDNGSRYLDHGL